MRIKFYNFLRLFNNGEPTRIEARYWLNKKDHPMSENVRRVVMMYYYKLSYEQIGPYFNFTRERVRQLVHKGCRRSIPFHAMRWDL